MGAGSNGVVPGAAVQIALWEEYSCKLEQRVHALTHENDALQRQIVGVQDTLAAAGASPPPQNTQNVHTHSRWVPHCGGCLERQRFLRLNWLLAPVLRGDSDSLFRWMV